MEIKKFHHWQYSNEKQLYWINRLVFFPDVDNKHYLISSILFLLLACYKFGFHSWDEIDVVPLEEPMQKHQKSNNEENADHQNDKENTDSNNLNAVSMTIDVPIVTISDDDIQHELTHTSCATGTKSSKQPLLFTGDYFEINSKDSAGTKAKCLTCQYVYTATKNVTSNLITHLKVGTFVFLFIPMNRIEYFSFLKTET